MMGRRVPPPQYEQITDGVRIRVRPKFMHDESEPARARFMWSYTVDVENESEQTWTIVRRHWRIVDAEGPNPRAGRTLQLHVWRATGGPVWNHGWHL